MIKPARVFLAVACWLTLAGPLSADEDFFALAGTIKYQPKKNVDFLIKVEMGKANDTTLNATIFRPLNRPEALMPAIVFIHGGGWRSGTHWSVFGAWLAERGYLVASIDYRLTSTAPWPAQIEDAKFGVRWLRAHASEYHIDPNRIGVFGTSAGGHLAACVGLMTNTPEFEGESGYPETSSAVQAVAAFCPPTDFTGDWVPTRPYPAWVVALFGVSREENPDLWKQASPLFYVHPAAPPFFIAHGENDTHVPLAQGEKLAQALEKAGTPIEFIPIRNGAHDFFVHPTGPDSTLDPTRESVMKSVLAFFDRNLKAP